MKHSRTTTDWSSYIWQRWVCPCVQCLSKQVYIYSIYSKITVTNKILNKTPAVHQELSCLHADTAAFSTGSDTYSATQSKVYHKTSFNGSGWRHKQTRTLKVLFNLSASDSALIADTSLLTVPEIYWWHHSWTKQSSFPTKSHPTGSPLH